MGTQEADRDWVDVANELLSKCHLNLTLKKLTDCDANVFIALYENILGEKVPDYIENPQCQEDDIHNVQSVIDSLSLDYLQISLSHITGENVVRGHKDGIKNLVEIFDGLLEYLNEETSEESQNSEPNNSLNEDIPSEERERELGRASSSSSGESGAQSSNHSHHSSNAGTQGIGTLENAPQSEAFPSAILLQPPSQSNTPYPAGSDPLSTGLQAGRREEEAGQITTKTSKTVPNTGLHSSSQHQSPAVSERSLTHQRRNNTDLDEETLEPRSRGPRKVLFHTKPDVLFLTLKDKMAATDPSSPDTEEEDEGTSCNQQTLQIRCTNHRGRAKRGEEDVEPLSYRRQKNRKAEEELHHLSVNLSHRLEELDQMLKRVLGETGESSEVIEGDNHSHHHDSVMEGHQTSRQIPGSSVPDPALTRRTHSLSAFQLRHCSHQVDPRDSVADSLFVDDGRQRNLRVTDQTKRGRPHYRLSQRKLCKYLLDKMYQEEVQRYEDKERVELNTARLRAQEAEREYRETILKDASKGHRQTPTKPKAQHKTTSNSRRGPQDTPRKAPFLKVKENDLLPVLTEELPHLHISTRALGQMWEEQMQQVNRLHAMSSSRSQRHSKLSLQLEEAQRKHDLLVQINRKHKEHSGRLREFKERIQQQRSTQNNLREQRQQIARAKKYYNEYHVQHRARLMRARTKEERMFRQLFEEGLAVQRDRLREQRAHARNQQLERQKQHGDYVKSLENYYKDQFSLLAEKLAQEREEIHVRKKAQEKALLKMKRELRSRMEREIRDLQEIIIENNEDDHFQQLDVQRLRNQIQLASFNYNTSYLS